MANSVDILRGFINQDISANGNIVDVKVGKRLGSTAFKGSVIYDSGRAIEGICKMYSNQQGNGWIEAAAKQAIILNALAMKGVDSGEILSVNSQKRRGEEEILIVRNEIIGQSLRDYEPPIILEKVRALYGNVFSQLASVSADMALEELNIEYCGDISPGNLIYDSRKQGFCIIEWDGQFGQTDMEDVTPGYVAPEVIGSDAAISHVLADTFSLGCVLARAIMGRKRYRNYAPIDQMSRFVKFDQLRRDLPSETHEFFQMILSNSIEERTPPEAENSYDHYIILGKMFGALN